MRAGWAMRAGIVILLAAASMPAAAAADPPTRVTIVAVFNPVTYGENAYVNGQLIGVGQPGQAVALEQSPPPFTDWTPVAQVTADAQGYYSFKLHPSQTFQYRTSSQGVMSERLVEVDVAPKIVMTAKAAGKSTIRYSGRFGPALDGQSVAIQRRNSDGSWTTIANARLHGGTTFGGRLTAHRKTTLRAMFATDGAHLDGFSKSVTVVPGTKAGGTAARAASCRAPRITGVATKPAKLRAGSPFTLRVTSALAGGKIDSIDVLWGDGNARDHFTLAPAYRRSTVVFALRHRYKTAGENRLTVRIRGAARGCRAMSALTHPRLVVS